MPDAHLMTWVREDPRKKLADVQRQLGDEDMANLDRDIGALEQAVKNLTDQIAKHDATNQELRKEIEDLKLLVASIKGGSKVILFIGSLVSGGLGAALVKFLPVILAAK